MNSKIDPHKIIADYLDAYLKASGRPYEFNISYESGWFVERSKVCPWYRRPRVRASDMISRTRDLSARIANRGDG